MNLIIDLIILTIAVVTVFLAGKRGFIKTAVNAASSLIALIVVFCFTGLLSGILGATPLADAVHSGAEGFVEDLTESASIAELVQDEDGPLLSVLEKLGMDTDEFSRWADDLSGSEDSMRAQVADYIADPITALVMKALSMLILFVATVLLLKLAGKLLTGLVEKIPFVRGANTLLGMALGAILALVRIFVFCAVVGILVSAASMLGLEIFDSFNPADTYLYRLFDAIQILKILF